MPQILNVYALPKLVDPRELAGGTVVVIDVLRATTTIVYAIEAGAWEVIPCLEVDDAHTIAKQLPPDEFVLGGERHGLPIDGFDLGNSPEEYTAQAVGGRTVVLTTTNGTRAISHARQAANVLIGAFVNASAVVRQLLGEEQIHILCAGTDDQFSEDDILLAGMLVERLQRRGGMMYLQNAQAITAREFWLNSFPLPQALGAEPLGAEVLAAALGKSPGGRNLLELDRDDDILAAARIDRFDCVPQLDMKDYRIRLA
jgi:2-phosphosulfolactate phosphatase